MPKKPSTVTITFKDPDFLYSLKLSIAGEKAIRELADFGEYFAVELTINPDGSIAAARFVQYE
jgi:hypothetical protein